MLIMVSLQGDYLRGMEVFTMECRVHSKSLYNAAASPLLDHVGRQRSCASFGGAATDASREVRCVGRLGGCQLQGSKASSPPHCNSVLALVTGVIRATPWSGSLCSRAGDESVVHLDEFATVSTFAL